VHRRALLCLLLVCPLLAACGSGGDDEPTKTTAESQDCPMSAAAARATHRRLTRAPRRSDADAEITMYELKQGQTNTVSDVSPDGRDVFVVVNDSGGLAGLRGTSGSRSVNLTARRGCGAVAYLRHTGPTAATFTEDGVETGGTGAIADQ
jgi:hypothetical protein